MAVTAPEAPKAATLDGPEVIHAPLAEIAKWEDGPDGELYVYGRATTPEVDTDDQICKESWSGPALREWLEKAPALRVQHNGMRDPAGSGVRVEVNRDGDGAHWVKAVVDEPVAQRLVRKGHLRAFSVGIQAPVIERDMTGKARGGIITGGRIVEVSLVDSPANRSCFLEVAKAAADGSCEFTGKVTAPDDILAKVGTPDKPKTVTVELPKNVSVSFSPKDLAKLVAHRQEAVARQVAKAVQPEMITKAAETDVAKRDFDPDVGGGVDRDKIPDSDFAGRNRSFPVVTQADVSDALSSIGRAGDDNYSAARLKRNILRIARRKGFSVPRADRKKADKAAKPDAVKCMKCEGSGMVDGSPCPSCKPRKARKAVRKALAEPAVAKKKKHKVICPSCGANQNREHASCSECGNTLASAGAAIPVHKNHDFTCLGCGKSLDKGEKFCPGCGRENPGYNPMADHKIPANKAAKEHVSKKRKGRKTGNGEPFGGKEAPPFGAKGSEDGAKAGKKAEKSRKERKGKGKGRSPARGVVGEHTQGLPPHREPDGGEVEAFERDAKLTDGDDEKATLLEERTLKASADAAVTMKSLGVPWETGALHALTCPAYSPSAVSEAFPEASLATLNLDDWRGQVMDKAAGASLDEARKASQLLDAALLLRRLDPWDVADIREGNYKAFRDANPGPGSFPQPGQISAEQFRRPYLDAGHAAPSPQHAAPRHMELPPKGGISAEDFTRGFISAGHAADSPGNMHPESPMPAPDHTGEATSGPARTFYRNSAREGARHAMQVMHDHISATFPDLCPLHGAEDIAQHPVPTPQGHTEAAPGLRHSKKSRKVTRKAAAKAAKVRKAKIRKLERRVLAGKLSVNKARKRLGLPPRDKSAKAARAVKVTAIEPPSAPPAAPALDPGVIKAAVAEATAPLLERQAKLEKANRKLQKVASAIAQQPDTSHAPMRGAALHKSASAAPAGPLTLAQSAEQAEQAVIADLYQTWRRDPDPVRQEAAWAELRKRTWDRNMTTQPKT